VAPSFAPARVSAKRFELLGGPGGYLTCLPVGDPRRGDRYRAWVRLATVNRPLSPELADDAKGWALRGLACGYFELV
jgi:hypothetical protein